MKYVAALMIFAFWVRISDQRGFDGIIGSFCANRPLDSQCCERREDECTARILGHHLCYCDYFCGHHTGFDCCPDFYEVCAHRPRRQPTRPPATTVEVAVTSPSEVTTLSQQYRDISAGNEQDCVDNEGRRHPNGETYQYNCNQCVCGRGCDDNPCLINTNLMEMMNREIYSWQAKNHSQFWGVSLENGVRYKLGTLYPERTVQGMNEISVEKTLDLPENFDARQKWPSYIHPIRDQKNCGSSWAFSTTAVSADRLAIQSDGKLNPVLSPQQLISCNQQKQKGCKGGYLDRAWWFIHKFGVVSEDCYPYESGDTNKMEQCETPKHLFRKGQKFQCPSHSQENIIYKMTPAYRMSSKEEDIQREIMDNGPVQATFSVHEDFYMYSQGVYRHLDLARNFKPRYRKSAYHSVRIIGWGVEESTREKFWLCDNSWGTDWGEDGFFRIVRGENHCEIESFILAAWGTGDGRRY